MVTTKEIIDILNTLLEESEFHIESADDNLEELGMSSIHLVELVIVLEDTYDIEIPDEYLYIRNMYSPQAITDIINRLLEAK